MEKQQSGGRDPFLQSEKGRSPSLAIEIPSLELPKGGGAVRGIDEKFMVNAVNGTATFSIPLPVSGARGIAPDLKLQYNSGAGNGIFGMGWTLDIPAITRKTEKGLPTYADSEESDTFQLAGVEDLVPAFKRDAAGVFVRDAQNNFLLDEERRGDFTIKRYLPRIESSFARIERYTNIENKEVSWRVTSKNNITTVYGWTNPARISDPEEPEHIFSWLAEFVYDDRGNCMQYAYKMEDAAEAPFDQPHMRNRKTLHGISYTNRYPDTIWYGNKTPYTKMPDTFPESSDYMFSLHFDYGSYETHAPFSEAGVWKYRADAFSTFHAGFEIRTTRLCHRIFLMHHFTGADEYNGIVRSLDLDYAISEHNELHFLRSATSKGYAADKNGKYTVRDLPAMEFTYQKHQWDFTVKNIEPEDLIHAPEGLHGVHYQFTDLFNEGLPGMLAQYEQAWYYKDNLGKGKFSEARLLHQLPSFQASRMQLQDLEATGSKQLVSLQAEPKGFFTLDDEMLWQEFIPFEQLPGLDMQSPDLHMIDLNGDGKVDILIKDNEVFTWYASAGRKGYSEANTTYVPFDEESGPQFISGNGQQSIFLADMSGDGLTDIVRIRNAEVVYWPNMGYGKFGKMIRMDNAPLFDHPEAFHTDHIRLADIDGSGPTDILYLGENTFSCWLNKNGNAFSSERIQIPAFPDIHSGTQVSVTDILGNGCACIVWSGTLPGEQPFTMKYIDLTQSTKPHVLIGYKNNMGKEVSWHYRSSTEYYLADKQAGNPWITKVHFPVHCISSVETKDLITGHRFVSHYAYHHGYYDHVEREFRGFGMVEQTDTEQFEHWIKGNASNIVDATLHQAPVLQKVWFHTGAFAGRDVLRKKYMDTYWYAEAERKGLALQHAEKDPEWEDILIPDDIGLTGADCADPSDAMEAARACKGMAWRSEIFALDAGKNGQTAEALQKEATPFKVHTSTGSVMLVQPKGNNQHAVFMLLEKESITYSYERKTEAPRVEQVLQLSADRYGNILETASIAYPRRTVDPDIPDAAQQAQSRTSIVLARNTYTQDIINNDIYRLRQPAEKELFALAHIAKKGSFYTRADLHDILRSDKTETIAYPDWNKDETNTKPQKRKIEHERTLYFHAGLQEVLPLYSLSEKGIVYEQYQLAYTHEMVEDIFGDAVDATILEEAQYMHNEKDHSWWIRSGRRVYVLDGEKMSDVQKRFYQPIAYQDPFGTRTLIRYWEPYHMFIREVEDALGNVTKVQRFDFRAMSPVSMQDINGNISEAVIDVLGMVKAIAWKGKGNEGDDLSGITETSQDEIPFLTVFRTGENTAELIDISTALIQHAGKRYIYDLHAFAEHQKPVSVVTIVREEHSAVQVQSDIQVSISYVNGAGAEVMQKKQAEPGKAKMTVIGADGSLHITEVDTSAGVEKQMRWIGSGKVILNNKGNAVKKYEPYFSVSFGFEDARELVETGVTPIMYYDAPGRLIRTVFPDGTYSVSQPDVWCNTQYDTGDTIMDSDWRNDRISENTAELLQDEMIDPAREKTAALQSEKYADTPTDIFVDVLGRPVVKRERLSHTADGLLHTTLHLDAEGNIRKLTDARGNIVVEYAYDMLGNMVYQKNMDSGERWLLTDVLGAPVLAKDARGHVIRYTYDLLHRPVQSRVQGGPDALDHIFDLKIYGESLLKPNRSNLEEVQKMNVLGKCIEHYDTGGLIETKVFDFKGAALRSQRRFCTEYKQVVNWTPSFMISGLEAEIFEHVVETDALGRMKQQTVPDGTVVKFRYDKSGALQNESVVHTEDPAEQPYIKNIQYNARGQRTRIVYGNDVATNIFYDKNTFRIRRRATQKKNNTALQDLFYTYDAAGNITHIEDRCMPETFFRNEMTTSVLTYTYDALYRLTEAAGRENNAALQAGADDNWNDLVFRQQLQNGDPLSVRKYKQTYSYDPAGNILEMQHQATGNNWKRSFLYAEKNNHLLKTKMGDTEYAYGVHPACGFIVEMPHLEIMHWNFLEQLCSTSRQKRSDGGTPETTWYQYDHTGKRIRKITENAAAPGKEAGKKEERLYAGGFEKYIQHSGAHSGLVRTTLMLSDEGNVFAMIETRNEKDDGTDKRTVRFPVPDHLGSAALELNEQGEVISYEIFYPFGSTAYEAKDKNIRCVAKRYRYTGMERDEENGFSYHAARYYIPWLGRWLSADPIGVKDGVNVFTYVQNNPINHTDVGGRQSTPQSVPPPGAIGRVERWIDQMNPRRIFGQIATEAEHVIPGASLRSLLYNPLTGGTDYGISDYMKDTTIVWEREAALMKTRVDNMMTRQLKGAAVDLSEITESSFRRTLSAAKATGSKVESEQVMHAVLGQLGNLFSKESLADSARKAAAFAEEEAKLIPKPVASELAPIAKEAGILSKVSKASKVLGPIGAVLTVFAISESVAHAAETNKEDAAIADDHDLLQDLNQFSANAEPVVLATTLLPGQAGFISGVAQGAYSVATEGIERTGGEKRIVEAAKGAEEVAEYFGASDVTKETVGIVAAGAAGIGEGVGVLGDISAGPIGWASLAYKSWSSN